MAHRPTLYEQAVEVGTDFLGPAGERFMRRQIQTHLDIEPEALRSQDVAELVNWVRLTFALLTDDASHVDAFADRLLALAEQPPHKEKARNYL
ncbi:MAG TPA: hypothetical protein VLE73_03270 [Candidatus Saccharimonadales bacterium]|nr:hypothetical protein [Candidatus Saccharimonadales bacterium]